MKVTAAQLRRLKAHGLTQKAAARELGIGSQRFRALCEWHGVAWDHGRHLWQPYEDDYLRRLYPHFPGRTIAVALDRTERQVYCRAKHLRLRKHPAYYDSPDCGRLDGHKGGGTRFSKGHVPFNKGRKGMRLSPATEFKRGHLPHTWVPVGTEVVDREGYLKRKVRDDAPRGMSRFNWRFVHVIHWERYRGPVPEGYVLAFRNGNKRDIRIPNLELITRGELARRNRMWNRYPRELARTIQHLGQFKRRLRERREQAT